MVKGEKSRDKYLGYTHSDARLMAELREIQALVHECKAPGCTKKFATADGLRRHQENDHARWPDSSQSIDAGISEDSQALRRAIMDVERKFCSMMELLIPKLSDQMIILTPLTRELNGMQDVYASSGLPTAAALSAGAVQYASLLSAEMSGEPEQKLKEHLRLALVNLRHAQGHGGELEIAFRSLQLRSALMDRNELRILAESGPLDLVRSAAHVALRGERLLDPVPVQSGVLGKPMSLLLTAAALLGSDPEKAEELLDHLPAAWAKVPWNQNLIRFVRDARS